MDKQKKDRINLLISNSRNQELLENLLDNKFKIISKEEASFSSCNLVIMDLKYFVKCQSQIKRLKKTKGNYTPIICMREKEGDVSQNIFELAEDVIELPVSKNVLLSRIKNLIQKKKLWDENQLLKDRYESIFQNINDMVFLIDILEEKDYHFAITETNDKLLEKLTYQEQALKNASPEKFMPGKDLQEMIRMIRNQGEVLLTTEFHTSVDGVIPVEINARKVQIHQKKLILCAARDITEQKEKEEEITYLSFHDDLTDLYNRRFLEEEIERLDTERQYPLSVFIIDINGMKLINDSYGHEAGDKLLIKTANFLREVFREEDIIARWGGDEFSVLLPQTTETEAEKIITRIKNKCIETENDKLPISLAVGYEVKENETQDIFEILNKADGEMYNDKLTAKKSAAHKILESLLSTLDAKSPETKAHTQRLATMAINLGEKIGLSNNQINNLSLLAILHDIGKINISRDILTKSEELTDEEWERIKEHPHIGYKIALSCDDFASIADEILAHHEHWDGEGYPNGLEKDEIPLLSRIISIVDAYDVMTNGRPYKEAMSKTEALNELKRCAGSQFDPNITEEFVDMMEKG